MCSEKKKTSFLQRIICKCCFNKVRTKRIVIELAERNFNFDETEEFLRYKHAIGEKIVKKKCCTPNFSNCSSYSEWRDAFCQDKLLNIKVQGKIDDFQNFLRYKIALYEDDCAIQTTIVSVLSALIIGVACIATNVNFAFCSIAISVIIFVAICQFIKYLSQNNMKKHFFVELLRISEEYCKTSVRE